MQTFLDRFVGVLRLDQGTFAGIKRDDEAANGQAVAIVALTGLLSGIGTSAAIAQVARQPLPSDPTTAAVMNSYAAFDTTGGRIAVVVLSVAISLVAWVAFAALARWLGRTLFGADPDAATPAQMRNLVAWGYAPGLLNVLAILPLVGGLISLVVAFWGLVTQVIGVRTALDLSTGRAVGLVIVTAILLGFLIACPVLFIVVALLSAAG
jgi:hypothetical protein